jgi:peptide/nickel transport system substrate-binding protein
MTRFGFLSRSRARRWAPLALAASLLDGCKGADAPAGGSGDVGGTVVISIPGDISTLVPGLVATQGDRQVTDLLFDRLADMGDDMNTVGDKG